MKELRNKKKIEEKEIREMEEESSHELVLKEGLLGDTIFGRAMERGIHAFLIPTGPPQSHLI